MTTRMFRCEFKALYNDLQDGEKIKLWQCDENKGSSNQFCCFHDKTKQLWDYQTFERLRKLILDSETTGEKLFLIGYYFPDNISFKFFLKLDPNPPPCKEGKYVEDANAGIRDTRQRICEFPIYLCDAEFNGQVEFSHCTFKKTLNMAGAIFRREVLFRDTIFKDKFYPRSTKFYGKVDFRKTEFNNADFHDTMFKDKANFRKSEILDRTRFLDVKFQDRANFVNTIFCNNIEFVGTSFNKAFFSPEVDFQTKTEFKYVVFENGEKIDFVTENLSNVSFMNTDVTRVKFSDNAKWGDTTKDKFVVKEERELQNLGVDWFSWNNVPGNGNHDFVIYLNKLLNLTLVDDKDLNDKIEKSSDEIKIHLDKNGSLIKIELKKDSLRAKLTYDKKTFEFFTKNSKNQFYVSKYQLTSLDSIKAIYRNLRENYEYRLRYDEAGEFFIREMELKRRYREVTPHSVFRHKIKNHFRSEKENPPPNIASQIRKNWWFRANISLTGFYRLASYGEKLRMPAIFGLAVLSISMLFWLWHFQYFDQLLLNTEPTNPLWNVTERSFAVFFQLRNVDLIWTDYIFKALGILSLGLFAIPLRRKFERKFRH